MGDRLCSCRGGRRRPLALVLAICGCGSVFAQDLPATDNVVVLVLGQGRTRQMQDISRDDLEMALPGTNALKLLEKLPGVSFQSADAFGAYEWSTRFGIRGFSQSQMGFTLDGIPLGDMSYSNNNGLHVSRAIAPEDLASVTVSQGMGGLGTASTSNLGGTVQFVSARPLEAFALRATQSFGSDDTTRSNLRLDTGRFGSGGRAFLSVTQQRAGKWKGVGSQRLDLATFKLQQPIGGGRLELLHSDSDRSETDYQDMSLEMTQRLGWGWDNYAPDWQRAVDAARGVFSGAVNSLDDAYFLGRGLRRDGLSGLALDLPLAQLRLKATLYNHRNRGQGHWYTPYTPSSPSVPISIRTTEYSIDRSGLSSELTGDWGRHQLSAGLWLERSTHGLVRNFYAVTGPQNTDRFLSGPLLTVFRQRFETETRVAWVQDNLSLLDDTLSLNFGVKSPRVVTDAESLVGTRAAGRLKASEDWLPQLGFNYSLGGGQELFGSVGRNQRAFQPGVVGPFSQNQEVFDRTAPHLKPERSQTLDLGYRRRGAQFSGSVALYHTDFDDRLLAVAVCSGIVGCPATFINVGRVTTRGVEAVGVYTPTPQWTWFNSVTWNDSRYRANYLENDALVRVKGKTVVDAPRWMWTTELVHKSGPWSARLAAKHTGRRYYSYTNDASVPAYTLLGAGLEYALGHWGGLRDWSWQFNGENLLDKRYFATLGSNGFAAADPHGQFATLLPGAPRQWFLNLSARY